MRTISLELPDVLDRKLTRLAARRRTSRSAVLRAAFEAYVERGGRSQAGFAPDLAGALDGPRGLSTSLRRIAQARADIRAGRGVRLEDLPA